MEEQRNTVKHAVPRVKSGARHVAARARNAVAGMLPGERPGWVVLDVRGGYRARRGMRRRFPFASLLGGGHEPSQEDFEAQVTALLQAPWPVGVVLRLRELRIDLATAFALRNQIARLRSGGKRVVVSTSDLNVTTYYLASAADEIVAPESASLWVHGMAVTTTFMAEALARFGVHFEKLAIEEYKNAGDTFALPAMSEPQRVQYDALLDSMERSYLETVGTGRSKTADEVRNWIDRGITSATEARRVGMIDRVAYEDEFLGERATPYSAAARFLPSRTPPLDPGRVAVVSLEGTIVTGTSRRSPVPMPFFGEAMAGSETLVRALRAAARDDTTAAVVFHVDSGGGSALASDLIWREVKRIAARKPVVAVMGSVAASGGYYVLTHATRVLAAPTTITGSIGVLMGKFVLEEFNARYGFNPETVARGRFANLSDSARRWDEAERELLQRHNEETYDRFVTRVADGRGLTRARVEEIGRGRIWSGRDALELGLVNEFGDVQLAIARAKELAGLQRDAAVWNVRAPQQMLLPTGDDATAVASEWLPLLRERALLMHPSVVQVR